MEGGERAGLIYHEEPYSVHAEIVVTGTELLLGEIVDTNSTMLARMLRDIGLDLHYKSTVGDNRARLAAVLNIALERSDIVLVSGGLGPTVDDITREAVADATGRPLEFRQELLDQIAARFARFGRQMTENNRRQAHIPQGAIAVENPVGTAPAFIVEDERGTIICLPGVPRELEYLMTNRIIPYLKERMGQGAIIKARVLRTCVIGESQIDTLIGDLMTRDNPTVGLAAHSGQVDVRITAKAASEAEADALIAPVEAELRARLGNTIYGEGKEKLGEVVARLLAGRGMTLALADHVTQGEVADRLENTPHTSVLVAQDRSPFLGVQITGEAQRLAEKARAEAGASLGLAILGATRGGDARPLVYLALSDGDQVVTRSYPFGGEDRLTRRWISIRALDLVRRYLIGALDEEIG
ncbi:MAG: CinA family nicotinamide mononucleotide deamidase-related protein [Anaerolineae bacterium]